MVCTGASNLVECPVRFNLTEPDFRSFSIGKLEEDESIDVSVIRIPLYPRTLDNLSWISSNIFVNETQRNYLIYHDEKLDREFGVRIPNVKCFRGMYELIGQSKFEQNISLSDNELFRVKADTVTVVGDLFAH